MPSGLGPAAAPIPQRGTAVGRCSEVSTHQNPDGTDVARPEQGALARCKYSLLVPEEPAGDLAVA